MVDSGMPLFMHAVVYTGFSYPCSTRLEILDLYINSGRYPCSRYVYIYIQMHLGYSALAFEAIWEMPLASRLQRQIQSMAWIGAYQR